MALQFEWDTTKASRNLKVHGVSFDEASSAFRDPLSQTIVDPLHSEDEERFILLGQSQNARLIVVVHTEREGRIRIISARLATRKEKTRYEAEEN